MISLVMATAFESCQAGLWRDGECLEIQSKPGGGKHDVILAPMVEMLLRMHKTHIKDLTEIIVTTGPGRFTGLRVGIAFARGLALVHRTTLKGVLTTDAFRWQLEQAGQAGDAAIVVAVKRGESFVQRCKPQLLPIERVIDHNFVDYFGQNSGQLGGVFSPEIMAVLKDNPHLQIAACASNLSLEAVYAVSKTLAAEKNSAVRPYYAVQGQ